MIEQLSLRNVGPAPAMDLHFGRRLNLLTGDNGLGKSFLLDIVWWALTRKWPGELNRRLPTGLAAKPHTDKPASITFSVTGKSKSVNYESKFDRKVQAWTGAAGRPVNPGLVLYAQADGSFAAWDPGAQLLAQEGQRGCAGSPARLRVLHAGDLGRLEGSGAWSALQWADC